MSAHGRDIRLGLRENLPQFTLLVAVNLFVGVMVGLERTVVPLLGEAEFGLDSKTAILSFIVSFGVTKASFNLLAARVSERWGRKRVLIAGWLVGLPVPFVLMTADRWIWIDAANVLLGINQALCWSMTVIMKVDLVGPRRRGLALGLNEFAGYGAVGLTAWLTGYLAAAYALRPQPFYLGVVAALAGLYLSIVHVRETLGHVHVEAAGAAVPGGAAPPSLGALFARCSWRDPALVALCQAGLVNNLNDALSWGIYPLFFAGHGVSVATIGAIKAIYPGMWGICQIATGGLSDRWGRKGLIVGGMLTQAGAISMVALLPTIPAWLLAAALQGLGTAMVYPTLLAAIGDQARPEWRASALGVYRFWRDLGYAVGALVSGLIADALGMGATIHAVAALTLASGLWVAARLPAPRPATAPAPA